MNIDFVWRKGILIVLGNFDVVFVIAVGEIIEKNVNFKVNLSTSPLDNQKN